jgi:hypothetical protein
VVATLAGLFVIVFVLAFAALLSCFVWAVESLLLADELGAVVRAKQDGHEAISNAALTKNCCDFMY